MITILLLSMSRLMYAAFGPPLKPPPRVIGWIGQSKIGVYRTRPCSFFAAWSPRNAHFFVHNDGNIQECLWDDDGCASLTEKASILRGLISWHSEIQPNKTIELNTTATTDADESAWMIARLMIEESGDH